MSTLDTLKGAYHRLDDRGRWAQGHMAHHADGRLCLPAHPWAVAWCASGAISASARTSAEVDAALLALARALKPDNPFLDASDKEMVRCAAHRIVIATNDDRGDLLRSQGEDPYEVIRAGFRKAIADLTPFEQKAASEEIEGHRVFA